MNQKSSGAVENISALRAQALIQEAAVQVVDIRTPEEFASGHVPGAVNIDLYGSGFKEKVGALNLAQPVLVYCQTGGRSSAAMSTFTARNFTRLYHMNRGFMDWEMSGLDRER